MIDPYSYDGRGNRIAEYGKKVSQSYFYDATNRMVHGTNWKGDTSFYTYNGLGLRINNTIETHAGKVYTRDYVIDYTSLENDDLFVYATGNEEYVQKHVYAGSERLEQITERGSGNWERTLYVHEDVMGNTYYFTKSTGGTFADLEYDAWGMPQSTNKLVNNDHGNFVFATYTGHIYDTTLDIYFAEARFYDATNRSWLAIDPIKDGNNWYQNCGSNPTTRWDPTGMSWWDDFKDWAGESWAKKDGYFKKLACDTGHWFDKNGERLINGIGYVTVGITAIGVTAAAAPVAIPMLAASLGASGFATLLASIGVYSVAGAGFVAATTGGWDIQEAFTGENYVRDAIGSDTYDLIQMGSGLYASAGTAYLSQFIVTDASRSDNETDSDNKKRTVEFEGKTVTMDDSTFDPNYVDSKGRTNLERMKQGLAPIGTDGKSVNIHHVDQTDSGPVVEMTATQHQQNYSSLHSNTGQAPSQIDRKAFADWRKNYWNWRSENSSE